MDYAALIDKECVIYDLEAPDLRGAVKALVLAANKAGHLLDADGMVDAILDKEVGRTTCQANGIIFPRATHRRVVTLSLMIGRLASPITCSCAKAHQVEVVVVLVGPQPTGVYYLKAMEHVIHALHVEQNRVRLIRAEDQDDLYNRFVAVVG